MKNWIIVIQGNGFHGTGVAGMDADQAALEFVDKLRVMGQGVEYASFVSGGKVDLWKDSLPNTGDCHVFINESPYIVHQHAAYGHIVDKSGFKGSPSVSFMNARFGRNGVLHPGASIQVQDGTKFHVCHTGSA